ncbi:MAG: 5-(carboxyamino)imidazole ribonucleotide synthase [Rickettsiales bacterium]|nr:5-(carboxyamino)imidazole ribonucleotide synthase [Rickettsiales bacterium]
MTNSLGILGGGQLGMFICEAATKHNIKTTVFSDKKNFSAKNFCDNFLIGSFSDQKLLDEFINSSNFFTIETENIPIEVIKQIEKRKKIFPSSNIVEITQNRLKEKNFLNSINGVKTAKFEKIQSFYDLEKYFKLFGKIGILKSCEMGYDGKGQYLISDKNINNFKQTDLKDYIFEEVLDFNKEISVIVCCSKKDTILYPPVENIHKNSILRQSIYPARIGSKVKNEALLLAKKIAVELKLHGILAIEMFLMKNDELLINELAPRPHNSGHWSLDFCKYSQFESLIFSIFKEKVMQPEPLNSCKMINVIGEDYEEKKKISEKYKFYDYFKGEIKKLRKMGHYTFKN